MPEAIRYEDIPQALYHSLVHRVWQYSIGLYALTPNDPVRRFQLLGAGTLVTAAGRHAILTAHHVAEILPRHERLGIGPFEGTARPHSVKTDGFQAIKIARGTDNSLGPDLAAIMLSEPIASELRARKSFFNLDSYRSIGLYTPPADITGVWLTNGFLDEWTKRDYTGDKPLICFENQSGYGRIERLSDIGEHDYFYMPLSTDPAVFPPNLGGMSGGGLWHALVVRKADGELEIRDPKLAGVNFYQVPTTDSHFGLRCHGRRSVYLHAYDRIARGQ